MCAYVSVPRDFVFATQGDGTNETVAERRAEGEKETSRKVEKERSQEGNSK